MDYPLRIRIGSKANDYVYTYVGEGVYRCRKHSEYNRNPQEKLCTREDPSTSLWVAHDAVFDESNENYVPPMCEEEEIVFSSGANILTAEMHDWRNHRWGDGQSVTSFRHLKTTANT